MTTSDLSADVQAARARTQRLLDSATGVLDQLRERQSELTNLIGMLEDREEGGPDAHRG